MFRALALELSCYKLTVKISSSIYNIARALGKQPVPYIRNYLCIYEKSKCSNEFQGFSINMKFRFSDDLEAQQYSLYLRLAIYNTGKKASSFLSLYLQLS